MNFNVKLKEDTPPFNVKFGWGNGEFEAGKIAGAQKEYDRFWDMMLPEGRNMFRYAFAHWTWEFANPKNTVLFASSSDAVGLFYRNENLKTINTEKFDFPYPCSALEMFYGCIELEHVPKTNLRPTNVNTMYSNCAKLRTVELFDVTMIPVNRSYSHTFTNCHELIDIAEIRGQISQNGLNLQWSTKLNKATIVRVVDALSPDTNGLTVTFSQTAKEAAFTDAEWAGLIGTKPNWTISLV